jgi:uncharacterized protein YebE (UPF0316 family)
MIDLLSAMPVWALAITIFCCRVTDVSLGTVRTLFVVQGRLAVSVLIGFVEVLLWVTAVTQVIVRVHESPVLVVAFAGGFAAGNAVGILIERKLAFGTCVLRMIVKEKGDEVAVALREIGHIVTTFDGEGRDGNRKLVYTTCPRRELKRVIDIAKGFDTELFYVVDRFSQSGHIGPLPHPTGWRAVLKKK